MSSSNFQALLFEGVFDTRQVGDEIQHWVQRPDGEQHIDPQLVELVGRVVQVAAHHIPKPPTPMDPSSWANIVANGVLAHDPQLGIYGITAFNGEVTVLDPAIFDGCHARVVAATADAIEQARDVVAAAGLADEIEGLGQTAAGLQGLLDDLVDVVQDKGDS